MKELNQMPVEIWAGNGEDWKRLWDTVKPPEDFVAQVQPVRFIQYDEHQRIVRSLCASLDRMRLHIGKTISHAEDADMVARQALVSDGVYKIRQEIDDE